MKTMTKNELRYGKDKAGKEILMQEPDFIVAMEWEKPYLEACIDAIAPHGDVLEIGFGLGYAAQRIQASKPKSHTILEQFSEVLKRARQWGKNVSHVHIVDGNVQEILPTLGQFDAIFLGGYAPAISDESVQDDQLFRKARQAKSSLLNAFEGFKGIKFSDAEIHEFSKTALDNPGVTLDQVEEFLDKLFSQENITKQQKENCLKELSKYSRKQRSNAVEDQAWQLGNPLILFIQYCLDKHMRPGATLSMRLLSVDSPKENEEFANKILKRKDVGYTEKKIPVNASNCPYFQGKEAYIIVIKKK